MRALFFSLVASLVAFSSLSARTNSEQDVFVPIAKYIQNGDSEKLSAWFAPNLEIDILGTVNVCSKAQAKQIIKEFFSNYSPKSFIIAYRSGKAPMKYAIGNLNAGGNNFRVTLFVKTQDDGNFIQQLRIEKE
ncbi:MAG: DUF4783 domain-containing protein [Rikenellaceae bacterium]